MAAARAPSASTWEKALIAGLNCSICARYAWITSTGESCFRLTSRARVVAESEGMASDDMAPVGELSGICAMVCGMGVLGVLMDVTLQRGTGRELRHDPGKDFDQSSCPPFNNQFQEPPQVLGKFLKIGNPAVEDPAQMRFRAGSEIFMRIGQLFAALFPIAQSREAQRFFRRNVLKLTEQKIGEFRDSPRTAHVGRQQRVIGACQ